VTAGEQAVTIEATFLPTPLGESMILKIPENNLDSDRLKAIVNEGNPTNTPSAETPQSPSGDQLCVSSAVATLSGRTVQEVLAQTPKGLITTPRRPLRGDLPNLLKKLTGQEWHMYRALTLLGPLFGKLELPNYPFAALVFQELPEDPLSLHVWNAH
jgi:hypothetical protein